MGTQRLGISPKIHILLVWAGLLLFSRVFLGWEKQSQKSENSASVDMEVVGTAQEEQVFCPSLKKIKSKKSPNEIIFK